MFLLCIDVWNMNTCCQMKLIHSKTVVWGGIYGIWPETFEFVKEYFDILIHKSYFIYQSFIAARNIWIWNDWIRYVLVVVIDIYTTNRLVAFSCYPNVCTNDTKYAVEIIYKQFFDNMLKRSLNCCNNRSFVFYLGVSDTCGYVIIVQNFML